MKRNSKRFLALFLSLSMSVTPSALVMAESADAVETTAQSSAAAGPAEYASGSEATPGLSAGAGEKDSNAASETPKTDAPESSDAKSADTESMDTKSPDAENTDAKSSDVESPDAESTDTKSLDTESSDTESTKSPDTNSSDAEVPTEKVPAAKAPTAEAPEVNTTVSAAQEAVEVPADTLSQEKETKEEETAPTATPTPASAETASQEEAADAGLKLEKEDGDEFAMFIITSSSVKRKGDKIQVTISTSKTNYDKIYIGNKDDEPKEPVVEGVENASGGYTYVFEVPASEQSQKVSIVPHSKKSQNWYEKGVLTITVPGLPMEEEPAPTPTPNPGQTPSETPAPEPTQIPDETPAPEPTQSPAETPTPEPTQSPAETPAPEPTPDVSPTPGSSQTEITDAGIKLEKEDGDEFAMLIITSSSVKLKGDKMEVTLSTQKMNYDKLYIGDKDAEPKEPTVDGVENEEGGYTYVFEIPASAESQKIAVVPHSKKSQNWYDKGILTITVPGLSGAETTPTVSPAPTGTPDPDETPTPEPTQTPDETPTPEPTQAPSETPTPEPSQAPATCEDGIYNVDVNSDASMFRVVNCALTVKDGKMTAVLTLSGTGYDYLYLGTKEEAAAADPSSWIPYTVGEDGKYNYEISVEHLDKGIAVAALSHRYQTWYDRNLTFQSQSLERIGDLPSEEPETPASTPTPTPTKTPSPTPAPTKAPEGDTSGSTSAVNSSTGLPDGTYTPDSFSWSGGTGKVGISCPKVTVTNGQAYATLVFSSEYYGYVKANGSIYYGSSGGGVSTFVVPVALNQNNTIIGMTTKMSSAHEITYTIFISLKESGGSKNTDSENPAKPNSMISTGNKKLDEEAPDITGLEYKGETETQYAKYFKLYHYEDGITLLEIDMTTDTAREEDAAQNEEDGSTSGNSAADGAQEEASDGESAEDSLYLGNVVKYLIVPQDAELPAGLDKDVIVIPQPVESVYTASVEAVEALDSLGLTDKISSLGFEKEDCTVESVAAAVEDGSVSYAGAYDNIDYKLLLQNKCGLAILPAQLLPQEGEDKAAKLEILKDVAERLKLLEIPFIADRSCDEEGEEAQKEWEKVYAAIFGTEGQIG